MILYYICLFEGWSFPYISVCLYQKEEEQKSPERVFCERTQLIVGVFWASALMLL
jgi:hypothetical protein